MQPPKQTHPHTRRFKRWSTWAAGLVRVGGFKGLDTFLPLSNR